MIHLDGDTAYSDITGEKEGDEMLMGQQETSRDTFDGSPHWMREGAAKAHHRILESH